MTNRLTLSGVIRRRLWLIFAVAVLCSTGVGYTLGRGDFPPNWVAMALGLATVGGFGLGTILAWLIEAVRTRHAYVEPRVVAADDTAMEMEHSETPEPAPEPAPVAETIVAEEEPIAEPVESPAAPTPIPLAADPVEQHRQKLRRGLVAARYLLRQAGALLKPAERDSIGGVVEMMRRDVDVAWRALRGGALPAAVASALHRNISGTVRTAELFGLRVTDTLASAGTVAASVVEDESAIERLTQHVWPPLDALAVVQALATELAASDESAEPTTWTPDVEAAAA